MFRDESRLIARQQAGHYGGLAVADIDGDGRFEFIVAGRPNRVLKWSDGRLRDVTPRSLADPAHSTLSIAAADIDGDGSEELYVVSESGSADRLFDRDVNGHWSDLLSRPENRAVQSLAATHPAAIDRRGAGRYAFAVASAGQPLRLLELGPHGALVDLAPSLELNAAGVHSVLAAPLLSDHTDLFCSVEHGPNLLFRNRGNGAFEECGTRLNLADAAEHSNCAVAVDAGGDGRLVLGLCNQEGPHRLFQRQGEGAWRDRATPAFALPSAAETLLAADFDNDGHDEILFNNRGQPNRLFRLGGEIVMIDPGPAAEAERFGTGAAVADIDGDGVLELLIAHADVSPALTLYKSPLAAGHGWLRVLPQTRFGAPARGAAVRAEIGGQTRVKVIDGGSGLCQMEPVAHFGLGRETRVDRVTVTWPDGSSLSFRDPDLNSTYVVPYPRG